MTKCFDYLECGDPERYGREGLCRQHAADEKQTATKLCPACDASAKRSHWGFSAGCRGCLARSVARSPHFARVRRAGKLDQPYRSLMQQMGVEHDEVKAAAETDIYLQRQAAKEAR